MNLYQLTEEYIQKIESVLSNLDNGEIDNLDDWLTSATNNLNDKRLAVGGYIKTLEAEKEAMNQAAENICERALKKEKHIEYLMEYLKRSLQRTETFCVNGIEFDIKLKTNPYKVIINDEAAVPQQWKTKVESIVYKPDKKLIKEAIWRGEKVPGCQLIQEERIEIK